MVRLPIPHAQTLCIVATRWPCCLATHSGFFPSMRFGISARPYHRRLRVARPIANLEGSERIHATPVAEALQLKRALRRSASNTQKDQYSSIQSHDIFIVESPDPPPDLALWHGGDLIHHQPTACLQSIAVVGLHLQAKQRRRRWIRCERTDGHGSGSVKTIVLEDHDGPWFPRVVVAARDCPDLATSHAGSQSEIASMKA